MTNGKKIIVIIVTFFVCLCFASCSQEYSTSKEEDYESYLSEVSFSEQYMPKLEDLGEFESVLITRKTRNDDFFSTTESIGLIVEYDQSVFETVVNSIDEKYDFIENEMANYKDFEAEFLGYSFRVDSNSLLKMIEHPSGKEFYYPSHSLVIGINTKDNKIAYLYYWDIELKEMDDLDNFIEKKFVFD